MICGGNTVRKKRGSGVIPLVLDELEECVSGTGDVEAEVERLELQKKLNDFLLALPRTERVVFMHRYWYMDSVSGIAKRFACSESKVKSMLYRTRKKLRAMLEKERHLRRRHDCAGSALALVVEHGEMRIYAAYALVPLRAMSEQERRNSYCDPDTFHDYTNLTQ